MTLLQFSEQYVLHDSSILEMHQYQEESIIRAVIEIPYWMQHEYNQDDPEIVNMEVTFSGISLFSSSCPDVTEDEIEITNCFMDGDVLIFAMYNNENCGYEEVRIVAQNVDVIIKK